MKGLYHSKVQMILGGKKHTKAYVTNTFLRENSGKGAGEGERIRKWVAVLATWGREGLHSGNTERA